MLFVAMDAWTPSMLIISLQVIVLPAVVAIAGAAIAAGTIATGAVSASGQAKATKEAAAMQQDASMRAVELQREQWQQGRQDIAPWRRAGAQALQQYQRLAQQGPPPMGAFRGVRALDPDRFAFRERFTAPTEADMMQDPGYQFRMQQGQSALERSAAARGGLFSGGFARGLQDYSQGLASQEYGDVYRRRLGEYGIRRDLNQQRYGRALAENQSAYERSLQRYTTNYNRGMGQWQAQMEPWRIMAGGGQTAATNLATLGGQYASNVGEILAANAQAQGAAGIQQANIWGNFANQSMNTLGGLAGLYTQRMGMGGNNPASTTLPAGQYPSGVNPWDPMWTPR